MIHHPIVYTFSARFHPPWKARQKVLQLDVHIPWFLGFGCFTKMLEMMVSFFSHFLSLGEKNVGGVNVLTASRKKWDL